MKILIITPTLSNAVLSSGTLPVSIALDEVPSGNVTITGSSINGFFTPSAPLTFTTGNFNVPQQIDLTTVIAANPFGWRMDTLRLTASGGGYDGITKDEKVMNLDSEGELFMTYHTGLNWGRYRKMNSVSDINTVRNNAIQYVFKGNLPTGGADAVISSYTGLLHEGSDTDYTNKVRVDKFTIDTIDSSAFAMHLEGYHIIPSIPNNKLMIDCIGNGEAGHVDYGNRCLAFGYDYLQLGLPMSCTNGGSDNPIFTGCGSVQRNTHFKTLDSPSFISIIFWVDQVVRSINQILQSRTINEISLVGTSGGVYTARMSAALDARIDNVFPNRGGRPSHEMLENFTGYGVGYDQDENVAPDSSQQVKDFLIDVMNNEDIIVGSTQGTRKFVFLTNENDSVGLGGYFYNFSKSLLDEVEGITGGRFKTNIDNDPGNETHQLSFEDGTKIFTELGDI